MKFNERLLTEFRTHFVRDLDLSPDDFFNTYRFLDWERDQASKDRDLDYQAQVYTLLGMLEEYQGKLDHSLKYFQLANDIFERYDNEDAAAYTAHRMDRLGTFV